MDKEIKLTEQIILDGKTMDQLKEHIREEVIEDILTSGAHWDEVEKYLSKRHFEDYLTIIKNTIDNAIQNVEVGDLSMPSGKRYYKILVAIKGILDLNM